MTVASANRTLMVWLTCSAALLLMCIALVGYAINASVSVQSKTNRQICVAFNEFDSVVTTTLKRSKANLPKITYFRDHPAELADQQAEIARQLGEFRQRTC